RAMPALARAQSISRRAAHLGFEWPNIEQVWAKVDEEMRELKEAAASGHRERTGEELGDLLFTLVNIARFLEVEAEDVLAQTVERFTRRFRHIEIQLRAANKSFEQSSLEEMDGFWEEAKKLEAREKSQACALRSQKSSFSTPPPTATLPSIVSPERGAARFIRPRTRRKRSRGLPATASRSLTKSRSIKAF